MTNRPINQFRLPGYMTKVADWTKYRLTYEGGEAFRKEYLKPFTSRETNDDFALRSSMTPIPTFAKAAVNDIRNSIYQPMIDIIRRGGSDDYHNAVAGKNYGIDRRGSSMNAFMGQKVLEELLTMGQVGVFIDAPSIPETNTLADVNDFRPFLYVYRVEDILSFACNDPENPSEFKSLLLRDTCAQYDEMWGLPIEDVVRYRHLWVDESDGYVRIQFYDRDDNPVDRDGATSGPIKLGIRRIPFVYMDIGPSLLIDVCEYQIAMLNLASSDVNYALLANFPFITEQADMRKTGSHLRQGANPDGTATEGGQGAHDKEIKVGVTMGRRYDLNMDRPGFIHPSSEPLKASMALQDKMEADIKKLVNLAVQTLATRQSAESKSIDNRGLEAGLSYIGLKMETAERLITEHWSAYEEANPSLRKVTTVKYPDRYSLKSNEERIKEADDLSAVITKTPSKTARKELWKSVCTTLLGGRIDPDTMSAIYEEIDAANFTTADPDVIIQAKDSGLVGEQLASTALGFPENEYLVARQDHIERLKAIAEHQGVIDKAPINSGPRGVADLDDNPADSGSEEKEESRDTDEEDTTEDRTRGSGKSNNEE